MTLFLAIVGWFVFGVVVLVGLALDLVGLFGNWLILLAVGAAWAATGWTHFGVKAMVALLALAVVGEILEALAAGYGAAKGGGSRGAVVAALVGCIAGAIIGTPLLFPIGTLIGACAGAFAGATGYELMMTDKQNHEAVRAGIGAALGKVAGMMAKTLVGLVMLAIAAFTY